jgi:hypothetical protein
VARDVSAGTRSGSSGASGGALHENSGVVASPSHRSRCAAAAPRKRYNRRSLGSPDDGADLPGTTRSARDVWTPGRRDPAPIGSCRGIAEAVALSAPTVSADLAAMATRACSADPASRKPAVAVASPVNRASSAMASQRPSAGANDWCPGTSPWQWRGPRRGAGHARRASLHYTCSFSVALPRVGVLRSRCPAIVTTQVTGLEESSNLGSRVSWVSRPPSSAARWPLAEWPWEPPFPPFP